MSFFPHHVSDYNSQGTIHGSSPTDKVGFHGSPAVVQRSNPTQVAIALGQQAGLFTNYNTQQTVSAVNATTTAEKSMTVQVGTGSTMLIAAGDLCYVNKPTSQAGLGMGNIRVTGSNTVGVTFQNATGSSITPTAGERYQILALRGLPSLSATLSPVAVPANTTMEQQFAVTGLPAGSLVQVSKPTAQAGLDIVGCRVVSSNVLGITFCNVTGSAITPTAAESYTVLSLFGLDALSNEINYGLYVGTVGAIGAGIIITGGATTLNGVLATDAVLGIFKPTPQAASTNAAYPIMGIPTTNKITLYFAGIGSGATPTAGEVYQLSTRRSNPKPVLNLFNVVLNPLPVPPQTTMEQIFMVSGISSIPAAVSGLWVNKQSITPGIGICGCRVYGSNAIGISYINTTNNTIDPPNEIYLIGNFSLITPGSGNSVYTSVVNILESHANLLNELSASMVEKGLIAGV